MKKKQSPSTRISHKNKSIAAMAVLLAHFSANATHEEPLTYRGDYQLHAASTKHPLPLNKKHLARGLEEHQIHFPDSYGDWEDAIIDGV